MISTELHNYLLHYDTIEKLLKLVTDHDNLNIPCCDDVRIVNAHNKKCNRCALIFMKLNKIWSPKKLKGVIKSITRSQQNKKMLLSINEKNKANTTKV